MTNAEKIAEKLIAASRGILTLPGKPLSDTLTVAVPVPHVMSVAAYKERFETKGKP